MKDHKPFKVKLNRTIRSGAGDVFRKNSIVSAEKSYGGYVLTKKKKRENGCIISINRIQQDDFETVE